MAQRPYTRSNTSSYLTGASPVATGYQPAAPRSGATTMELPGGGSSTNPMDRWRAVQQYGYGGGSAGAGSRPFPIDGGRVLPGAGSGSATGGNSDFINPGAAGSILGDLQLPDFDANSFISGLPTYEDNGRQYLMGGLNSGRYNVSAVSENSDLVRQRQQSAEAAGQASGRMAADDLMRSRGSGSEGLAGLLRMQGASQGYRQGLDVADEERWRLTALNAQNADRDLNAAMGLVSADNSAFANRLAGSNAALNAHQFDLQSALGQAGLRLDENNQLWGQAMDRNQFGLLGRQQDLQEKLANHGIDMDNKQFGLLMDEFALQKEQHGLSMDQMKEQLRSMQFSNDQADQMLALFNEYMDTKQAASAPQWFGRDSGVQANSPYMMSVGSALRGSGFLGGGGGIADTGQFSPITKGFGQNLQAQLNSSYANLYKQLNGGGGAPRESTLIG